MFDFSKIFSTFKGGKLNGFDAMILTESYEQKKEEECKAQENEEDEDED